ncbi:hypothetical protein HN51_015250, partial [Arachis hypogaea]
GYLPWENESVPQHKWLSWFGDGTSRFHHLPELLGEKQRHLFPLRILVMH